MDLFIEFEACSSEREEFCSLLKQGATIEQVFASRPDWVAWCIENIPCNFWPNDWVIAFATINPVHFGLMLSLKAPGLIAYGANLNRANLYGASLYRANLDCANLDGARGNKEIPGWHLEDGIYIKD